MEEWRVIPIAPRYEASSLGRIRNAETGLVLKQKASVDGYLDVCLTPTAGKRLYRHGHQLVALAFLGPIPFPKACVAHKDGTRTNNVPDNLYWATMKQNHADREMHGRAPKGSRNGASKITERDVTAIKAALRRGDRHADISEAFGICKSMVSHINTGKNWSHTP